MGEANRYQELKLLERAGEISDLELQPKFTLVPKTKNERAVTYKADFQYYENEEKIVEDFKGFETKDFIIKKKLFKHLFPNIGLRIVK